MRWFLICFGLFFAAFAGAAELPAYLPKYDLNIQLDTNAHTVKIRETLTWTNPADKPTRELQLNFYPHFKVKAADELKLLKTLELFRLNPADGYDPRGVHGEIESVNLAQTETALPFKFRDDVDTAFVVELPNEVGPGQSIKIELVAKIRLPNKQGRWGHWNGVHFLGYCIPTAAYFDNAGWHAMPFIPWHQPFWQEAGIYNAVIEIPSDQKLACSAQVKTERVEAGWRTLEMQPFVGRDFAMVSSADFHEFKTTAKTAEGQEIAISCLAFEKHRFYAEKILTIVAEALPIYAKWFGPFPYSHFTVVESFFGWNGNELGGMILIDERVFDMSHAAVGYVEYLVSHETCHQYWYNLIGSNGYAESFMDEGPATYFTHKMLNGKRGRDNPLVKWDNLPGTPVIRRENYRNSAVYGAINRNEMTPAAATLPEFGHLGHLFTGAYDRGSKVFGMIEERMGEASFNDFIKELVAKYSWRVLSAARLQSELEAYTGKKWDEFFDQWVYGKGLTDWSVETVTIDGERMYRYGPMRWEERKKVQNNYKVVVRVRQNREYDEPTTLGIRFAGEKGYRTRIPIPRTTESLDLPDLDARVEPDGSRTLKVTINLPEPPVDVRIDPESVILDADPSNNAWRVVPTVSILPFYSMVNDTALTNDYDRWNLKAGGYLAGALYPDPWFTRGTTIGVRAGATRTDRFNAGVYSGYRSDYNDLVLGADGVLDHFPFPHTQLGFNAEQRLAQFGGNGGSETATRAVLYGRYTFQEGSSLYLPPISYADLFTAYSDNFLPTSREHASGGDRMRSTWLTGAHYRLNLYTPYWDPERGIWFDATYAAGPGRLRQEGDVTAQQVRGELATVQKLPEGYGYLSDVKFAVRGIVASSWPQRGEFFTLGGSTAFRGFDLAQRQGNALWTINAEARLPIFRNLDWNFADRVVGVREIHFAGFYDVGGIYANGNIVGNVAHALGCGLRVNLAFFSFMERATMRVEIAKTLNANTPVQFWWGVQHPF